MGANYRAPYSAPWRGIARLWYLKNVAQVDWPDSSHRHGNGLGVAESTQVDKIKVDAKSRNELARDIKALARNGVVVLPPGYTYKIITDTANTWTTFKAQMECADLGIDMGLTGTTLTTEVNGGAYSAASIHASLDSVRMSSFLELASTGSHDQILPYWASLNFATDVVPYPHWDTTPPEDKKAVAEARKADADAFKTYVEAGAEIDQLAWFNEGVVRLRPGATAEVKRPEPAAPAVAQPPAAQPKPAKSSMMALDSTETPNDRGIGYVEKVEGACSAHMAKALIPTVARVMAAIAEATDFDDAYRRVTEANGKAPTPTEMVTLVDRALIMTQLAGVETVEQEDGTEG
jgi:phage gp29-like protein